MVTICRNVMGFWVGFKYARGNWTALHFSTECGVTVLQVGPVIVEYVR